MLTMKAKSKVSKFTGDRKHIEIPILYREDFKIGDEVYIERIRRKKRS